MAFRHIEANETLSSPPAGNGVYASYTPMSSNANFSILAISIIGIIATAFLLVSYYVFGIKCCLNWQQLDHIFRQISSFRHLPDSQNRRQQRPVICTSGNKGLEEYVIRSIPVFLFRRKDRLISVDSIIECSVCLNQFEEGERLRVLPKCAHAFHIDCIDTWLQSHPNCPICRSSVLNTVVCHEYRIEIDSPSAETHRSFDLNDENGFPRENATASQSLEMGVRPEKRGQSTMNFAGCSNNVGLKKLQSGFLEVKFTRRNSALDGKRIHHKHHLSSAGDECIDARERGDEFLVGSIRRSFSMDSCVADRQLYISVAEILSQNPHLKEVGMAEEFGSKTKRSFFPFSHGRGIHRNGVLPVRLDS